MPILSSSSLPHYPAARMRRLRRTPALRRLATEHRLSANDFIYPVFVRSGSNVVKPIASMPGVDQRSVDRLSEKADEMLEAGVSAMLLFGIPAQKDSLGASSWANDGVVQQATRSLRQSHPELVLIADVCFCEYTDHGHCGVLKGSEVDNDATLENLARQALSLAEAGVDIIAPSDMMDGRIGRIRTALDQEGFSDVPLMSYAAKYASAFYGPFRDAAESAPAFGDRRSYQMSPANRREALLEVMLDISEGADIVMVKPAMPYLDIVSAVREQAAVPVAAYQVSGEYSMLRAAADRGWLEYPRVLMESLLGIRRAGADLIITYGALDASRLLREGWSE